jgi:3-methyladenine DNA glycosylase/8-oxoguanine DNA glycosylase
MPEQPDWTTAVAHLRQADQKLAALIDRVGSCNLHIRHEHSIFYTLLRSIIYQQLAGSAAAAIMLRVESCLSVPGKLPDPQRLIETPDEKLRAAGLSRNKLLAVKDLAAKALDGTIPSWPLIDSMSEEEIIERCVKVRGIGRWTVEMLLIFRLGRLDVLPLDDYGVRKGIQYAYRMRQLPDKKRMLKLSERWRPYRSIASWYFWRACDLPENKEREARRRAAARRLEKQKLLAKKRPATSSNKAAPKKKTKKKARSTRASR